MNPSSQDCKEVCYQLNFLDTMLTVSSILPICPLNLLNIYIEVTSWSLSYRISCPVHLFENSFCPL